MASALRVGRRALSTSHLYWATVIFAVALVLRLVWLSYLSPPPLNDGVFYWNAASTLAAGEGYLSPFDGSHTANLPPGYPLVLTSLFAVFGTSYETAHVFNAVVGSLTAVLVYVLATRLWDQRAGVLGGLVLALFPSQVYFTSMFMTELFFALLAASFVLLLVVWQGDGQLSRRQVFGLGLFLGFLALVRAEALLLLPLLLVLWKLLGQSWLRLGQHALFVIGAMALVITPWTVRNYVQLDEFYLIRSDTGRALRSLRIGMSLDYDDPRYTLVGGRQDPQSFGELGEYYATHPWQVFRLGGTKIADLFGRDDAFHWVNELAEPYFTQDQAAPWARLGDAYYYGVGALVLASAGLWFSRRDRRQLIVVWFIGSWSLIHLTFSPEPRYHFPIVPMLSALAGAGLASAWDRARVRQLERASFRRWRVPGLPTGTSD